MNQKKKDSKTSSTETIDPSLLLTCSKEELDLFCREFLAIFPMLQKEATKLKDADISNKDLNSLLKNLQSIKSGSKIIQIKQVVNLLTLMEFYLNGIKVGKIQKQNEDVSFLNNALSLLHRLVKDGGFEFLNNIKIYSKDIDKILDHFYSLHDLTIEEKDIKREKEFLQKEARMLDSAESQKTHAFLKIASIVDDFNSILTQLEQKPQSSDAWNKIINVSKELAEASKKIQIPIFIKLAQAITESLIKSQANHSVLSFEQLMKASDAFYHLTSLPVNEHSSWLSQHKEELEELSKQLVRKQTPLLVNPYVSKKKVSNLNREATDKSLFDLFRIELELQSNSLSEGLLTLEGNPQNKAVLESLMRAAHSIKGAARVIEIEDLVSLAHALEDCFSAGLADKVIVEEMQMEVFLQVVDFFSSLYRLEEEEFLAKVKESHDVIEELMSVLQAFALEKALPPNLRYVKQSVQPLSQKEDKKLNAKLASKQTTKVFETNQQISSSHDPSFKATQDRFLRVTAKNLNRLMGLAGETMVESLWLQPFGESLLTLKRSQDELALLFDLLRDSLEKMDLSEHTMNYLNQMQHKTNECRQEILMRASELETFIRSHESLGERLYGEVVDIRMRPFADGVKAFPRMVRDLARQLGKKIKFEIIGMSTSVDRDILEKLESPLTHLLRNAVDHGIETPAEREAQGKPPEGLLKLEAHHRAGMLAISVSDDGRGIDFEKLRHDLLRKKLVTPDILENLTETELLDFLFLPGFSTAGNVTEISGRGVGLNVVQNVVQEVGGIIRTVAQNGKGITFNLQLPLTLSVIRCLLAEISGEPYAFPLARIDHALYVQKKEIQVVENRQYFTYEGTNIGLISAHQILDLPQLAGSKEELSVILISDRMSCYGVVVDRFLGGKELVVLELDPNIGKIPNINSGAFMENGLPLLIVDVDDMMRSIDKILSAGAPHKLDYKQVIPAKKSTKKILIVDDSITVREVECRLLQNQGYQVDTAVNGIDGWNAIRTGSYDLVITDVDMPRMNGVELVKAIKKDPRMQNLPVMIVSYKDREEDRRLGLEAGANYYLTKSSFHDETLINAVTDLIGNP